MSEAEKEALQPSELPVTLSGLDKRQCLQCARLYSPKRRHQTFCSVACRVAHFRSEAPPKIVKRKAPPAKPREPKDGLRCKICTDFIDSREGWRVNCKSCDRLRMLAWHNPARCTLKGCIVCMNAELARSPEFVAAWEAESGNEP